MAGAEVSTSRPFRSTLLSALSPTTRLPCPTAATESFSELSAPVRAVLARARAAALRDTAPAATSARQENERVRLEEADDEPGCGSEGLDSAVACPWVADSWDALRTAAAATSCMAVGGLPPAARDRVVRSQTRCWDIFYKHHGDNFFLERSYLARDFPALARCGSLLEIGCGTGASFLPLLARYPGLHVTAFDLSARAVALASAHAAAAGAAQRVCAFVGDAAAAGGDSSSGGSGIPAQVARALSAWGAPGCAPPVQHDAVLMLYALSALPPEAHARALAGAAACLRPGGLLLLRDYGAGDAAQARFGVAARLDASGATMVRGDGTLAAFLDVRDLAAHAARAGLEDTAHDAAWLTAAAGAGGGEAACAEPAGETAPLPVPRCGVAYVLRAYSNRAEGITLRRVWVHGVWRKRDDASAPPVPPLPVG